MMALVSAKDWSNHNCVIEQEIALSLGKAFHQVEKLKEKEKYTNSCSCSSLAKKKKKNVPWARAMVQGGETKTQRLLYQRVTGQGGWMR